MEFIDGLSPTDAAAVLAAIQAFALEFPRVVSVVIKPLQGKLWEMKVRRFRVLYGVALDTLIVVHVFAKKTNKTPKHDLELAAKRLQQMLEE